MAEGSSMTAAAALARARRRWDGKRVSGLRAALMAAQSGGGREALGSGAGVAPAWGAPAAGSCRGWGQVFVQRGKYGEAARHGLGSAHEP
ncbi:MAG: hypothetical protein AAFQ21_12625, partial [Pseudomonadota bacterium]